jgi:hypothetical protein
VTLPAPSWVSIVVNWLRNAKFWWLKSSRFQPCSCLWHSGRSRWCDLMIYPWTTPWAKPSRYYKRLTISWSLIASSLGELCGLRMHAGGAGCIEVRIQVTTRVSFRTFVFTRVDSICISVLFPGHVYTDVRIVKLSSQDSKICIQYKVNLIWLTPSINRWCRGTCTDNAQMT